MGQKKKENIEEAHLFLNSLGPEMTHITFADNVLEKTVSQPHIIAKEAERFHFFEYPMKGKAIFKAAISFHHS